MNNNFVVEGWKINGDGSAVAVSLDDSSVSEGYWLHCDRSSNEFQLWLEQEGIDPSTIASLLASDTRPRFQQIDKQSFFLILRGVNLNPGKEPDDMITIRLLYTPKRVITCNLQHSRAIESLVQRLINGNGPDSIEQLVIALITLLNEKIDSVIEPIEHFIDSQDVDAFDNEQIGMINQQHRKLLKLNRFLKPQISALVSLCKNKVDAFESYEVSLANQLDSLQRIVDAIDFYIAQIDVINNRINQINSELMNRNTYLLSIIAGIFLPLGFLTGLFGINIGGMPGVEYEGAFYWFCGILTGLTIFELILFRRLKFL